MNNEKLPIMLDMDGVVCDWMGGVCKLLDIDLHCPVHRPIMKATTGMIEGGKFQNTAHIDKIILEAGYGFWMELELYPWAHDLYNLCSRYGEVYFLTAPGRFHHAAHAKLDYIEKHFGSRNYILTKHKYFCAGPNRILIDDMQRNIDEWKKAGGTPFHWPNCIHLLDEPSEVGWALEQLEVELQISYAIHHNT